MKKSKRRKNKDKKERVGIEGGCDKRYFGGGVELMEIRGGGYIKVGDRDMRIEEEVRIALKELRDELLVIKGNREREVFEVMKSLWSKRVEVKEESEEVGIEKETEEIERMRMGILREEVAIGNMEVGKVFLWYFGDKIGSLAFGGDMVMRQIANK